MTRFDGRERRRTPGAWRDDARRAGRGARRAVALLVGLSTVSAAWAQRIPARPDSLPPLPDTLRLYGGALPVRAALPSFGVPAGAAVLTVEEAVALALDRNPDRRGSVAEAERAANDVTRGNAGYLPTLDASADYAASAGATALGGADNARRTRSASAVGADLTLGYTVFDGGRRGATYRRLRAEADRAALFADADAEALVRDVVVAYADLLRQQGLEAARAEQAGLSEDRLRLEAARARIGVSADVDAALALSDLNTDRAALLRQRLALRTARVALGALLALPDPAALVAADTMSAAPGPGAFPVGAAAAVDTSGAANRDVRALRVAEDAARAAVGEARAAFAPTVRLVAGTGLGLTNGGLLRPVDLALGPDFRYGITASLPLFDGGERRRLLQNAEIRLRQAELTTEGARVRLRGDLARLTAQAEGFRGLVGLETQNVAVARASARVALRQLELGFITALDLRQVQLALLDAETRRVDARFQLLLAETDLRLRAGTLLPAAEALAD